MAWSLVVGGVGAGLAPLAVAPRGLALGLVVAAQFALWFGQQVYHVQQVPLRYLATPSHLHGRVNATIRTVVWGAAPGGALLGGLLGDRIGLRPTLVVCAAGCALAALWIFGSPVRRLRQITDFGPTAAVDPSTSVVAAAGIEK
jgi:predicted MFS family arabinose efflux permease